MNMKAIIALLLMLNLVACGTVAGLGQDLKTSAEWTKDKMTGEKLW
jgi:predicted small secreted protein